MRLIVWLARFVAGAAVGVATDAMFSGSRIRPWLPVLVGSVLAAVAVPAASFAIGSRHYTTWIARRRSVWRSPEGYIALETAIGWPIVAVASFGGTAFMIWLHGAL